MSNQFFVRFVANKKQATSDLERGYSFHGYNLHDSIEDILEFSGYEINDDGEVLDGDGNPRFRSVEDAADELDIRQDNVTGMFGFAADGLAGFGPFDSLEEAMESETDCHYGGGEMVSFWRGDNRQDCRVWEGTTFAAKELLLVRQRVNHF